jgi:hypothetical protein
LLVRQWLEPDKEYMRLHSCRKVFG